MFSKYALGSGVHTKVIAKLKKKNAVQHCSSSVTIENMYRTTSLTSWCDTVWASAKSVKFNFKDKFVFLHVWE